MPNNIELTNGPLFENVLIKIISKLEILANDLPEAVKLSGYIKGGHELTSDHVKQLFNAQGYLTVNPVEFYGEQQAKRLHTLSKVLNIEKLTDLEKLVGNALYISAPQAFTRSDNSQDLEFLAPLRTNPDFSKVLDATTLAIFHALAPAMALENISSFGASNDPQPTAGGEEPLKFNNAVLNKINKYKTPEGIANLVTAAKQIYQLDKMKRECQDFLKDGDRTNKKKDASPREKSLITAIKNIIDTPGKSADEKFSSIADKLKHKDLPSSKLGIFKGTERSFITSLEKRPEIKDRIANQSELTIKLK